MTERNWTPGPWFMGGSNVYTSSDEPSVAVMVRHRAEWEDNAHLIAAAPDMYEALEACVQDGLFGEVFHKACDALAKARGETK